MRRTLAICLFMVAACGSNPPGTGDDDGDDGDDGDDSGDDVGPDPDASPDTPNVVRFVALGDSGKGNDDQRFVGDTIAEVCAVEGCDFVLLLGDNIYDAGPDSPTDQQWMEKFEIPYQNVDLPFYPTLGNHDYGGEIVVEIPGLGNEWDKAAHSVGRTAHSTKWKMPATYYHFTAGHVGFIALDTNAILWGNEDNGDEVAWFPTALQAIASTDWKIAYGHHPYRSNGTHGDAGSYDAPEIAGFEIPNPLPIQNGAAMQDFYEDHLCGEVDVLITGHDHSRMWINEPTRCGGTEMIVSGNGASVTEIAGTTNATFYEDASEAGFFWVEIDGDTFTGRFYDLDGNVDFERTITH